MQKTTTLKMFLAGIAAAVLLAGCASTPAPVVNHSFGGSSSPSGNTPPPTASGSGVQTFGTGHANGTVTASGYRVAPGDTLYSIAFANGIDFRALAAQNNIAPPYVIHPGQVLRLTQSPATPTTGSVVAGTTTVTAPTTVPGAVPTAPPAAPAAPVFGPVTSQPLAGNGVAPASSTGGPAVAAAGSAPAAATTAPVAAPAPVAPVEVAPPPPAATRNVAGIAWRWPAGGKVIGGFQSGVGGDGAGLDIDGNVGDPVRAAAAGTVVYSGNGLIGYGELVIIKHNDTYLSAYGHNSKRLVKEGQHVDAGQEIAQMGASGAPRVELHFEIRKNGKPVDPLGYLPQR